MLRPGALCTGEASPVVSGPGAAHTGRRGRFFASSLAVAPGVKHGQ